MDAAPARIIRAIGFGAALGALAALAIPFTASHPNWRNRIVAWHQTTSGEDHAVEAAPLCNTADNPASDADWATLDPDFAAGKQALAKGDWTNAITALKFAAVRDPRDADIQTLIGYAYQRLGQPGPAMGHLQQALLLNPRHRGAHEHLGELFLALDEPAQAEQHLASLQEICLISCGELDNLQHAIAADRASLVH